MQLGATPHSKALPPQALRLRQTDIKALDPHLLLKQAQRKAFKVPEPDSFSSVPTKVPSALSDCCWVLGEFSLQPKQHDSN